MFYDEGGLAEPTLSVGCLPPQESENLYILPSLYRNPGSDRDSSNLVSHAYHSELGDTVVFKD